MKNIRAEGMFIIHFIQHRKQHFLRYARDEYLIEWSPTQFLYWGCGKYRNSKTTCPKLCHVRKEYTIKTSFQRFRKKLSFPIPRYVTIARQ